MGNKAPFILIFREVARQYMENDLFFALQFRPILITKILDACGEVGYEKFLKKISINKRNLMARTLRQVKFDGC